MTPIEFSYAERGNVGAGNASYFDRGEGIDISRHWLQTPLGSFNGAPAGIGAHTESISRVNEIRYSPLGEVSLDLKLEVWHVGPDRMNLFGFKMSHNIVTTTMTIYTLTHTTKISFLVCDQCRFYRIVVGHSWPYDAYYEHLFKIVIWRREATLNLTYLY